jgi:hypothetical protein
MERRPFSSRDLRLVVSKLRRPLSDSGLMANGEIVRSPASLAALKLRFVPSIGPKFPNYNLSVAGRRRRDASLDRAADGADVGACRVYEGLVPFGKMFDFEQTHLIVVTQTCLPSGETSEGHDGNSEG